MRRTLGKAHPLQRRLGHSHSEHTAATVQNPSASSTELAK
jgi:hypothetical protein